MKSYYAYIRVSTTRQGDEGVSLQEQRRAILEYASRRGIAITEWFEEQISAAKRGRPVFSRLVSQLKAKRSVGLIIHKIDRGSRNLRDWADIGDLMDRGIEVYFAHESIDLHTRSGRLSADILAVVAADYIRNLREEVVKGINGRLRQGLFPFAAPVGYVNTGSGKPKTIDPARGPFIRLAFELYASRKFSLKMLEAELHTRGLRTKKEKRVYLSQLATILRNPFYMGLIRLKNRKEMFPGVHTPLIPASLYNQVQLVLDGKRTYLRHLNPCHYRLLIKCQHCKLYLVGERHKGHVYYRCHRSACPRAYIREERFQEAILEVLKRLNISPEEEPILAELLKDMQKRQVEISQNLKRNLEDELSHLQESIKVLLQKFLDNIVSKELFDDAYASLLVERKSCEERLHIIDEGQDLYRQMLDFLAGLRSLCERFCTDTPTEVRKIVEQIFATITTDGPVIHMVAKPLMEQIGSRDRMKEGWQNLFPAIISGFLRT